MRPPGIIVCVDCGFDAHLLQVDADDWEAGDVAAYRCSGCGDRWDLELEADDLTDEAPDDSRPDGDPRR